METPLSFNMGSSLPTIQTARLRVRWLVDDDVPALLSIFGDPEVLRYWSHGPFGGLADAAEYLRQIRACFAERSLFQWGVEWRAGGGIIGTVTLAQLSAQHRRAELGFALARAHWRQGVMREALPAMLGFAFDQLGLERLTADADPRNAASIALLEKLGFAREGFLPQHYRINGEIQDAAIFGLMARQWREAESGMPRRGE